MADKIPLATSSHRVIPPKILIKTDLTEWSIRMIRKAADTLSALAPPPISRKLAGFLPQMNDIHGCHGQSGSIYKATNIPRPVLCRKVRIFGLQFPQFLHHPGRDNRSSLGD